MLPTPGVEVTTVMLTSNIAHGIIKIKTRERRMDEMSGLNEARTIRHTINVKTEMHRFGDGQRMDEAQGYRVEFFKRGEFVESRSYAFTEQDEAIMATRITEWVRLGYLPR
jgi:hypothetical protein